MKTIKTNLAGFILLVFAASSLFLTCDVGLGNSVSTKPPTVSIAYPPVDSIIKNTFTMNGKADTETSLKQVAVQLTDTTTASKTFGPYLATVDAAKKTWTLFVNKKNSAGAFEVPDGSYQAVVTATDDAGRTNTAAITYRIDNTPPVLVLQSPSTVASDSTTTAFGKNMNITGMVADTNSVQTLTLTVYDRASLQPLLAKSFGPIPPNIDVSLPDDLYASLYGNASTAASSDGTKKYYYTVSATDYAAEYTPETSTGAGNTTDGYYIYSKIYSTVFGGTTTYTMTDLQNIFNGSKADSNNILAYLAQNKISSVAPTASTSASAGTFSINPSNNPTFTVQTFDAMTLNQAPLTYPAIAKNSTISIQVSVGLDNVPLVENSIGVTMYYMADFSSPLNTDGSMKAGTLSQTLLHSVGTVTPEADATARATDLAKKQTNGTDSAMTVSSSGSNYLLAVYLPDSLSSHADYYLSVTGHDKNGKEVSIGTKKYGFHISGTGVRPIIAVDTTTVPVTPDSNTAMKTFIIDGKVHYFGTLTFANGYKTFAVSASPTASGTTTLKRHDPPKDAAVTGDMGVLDWDYTADITSSSGGDNEFTFTATDQDGGTTTEKYHFYYDKNPPTITINSVSPGTLVSTDYSVNPLVVKDINGTITIKGNFSDDYRVSSGSYNVNSGGAIDIASLASWSFNVDTSTLADKSDNNVNITTTDSSGQTATKTITLKVDQSTDIPIVTFTNYDPNTTLPNGLYPYVGETTLKGMVSDDDGVIASMTAKVNGVDVAVSPSSGNFSIPMGSEGSKTLVLGVTDKAGKTFTFDMSSAPLKVTKGAGVIQPSSDMTIVVDTATPVVSIDQVQNDYHKALFTLSGTASDSGTGILGDKISVNGNANVAVDSGTHTWTTSIDASSPSMLDGNYTIPIVAYDKTGQVTNATFNFKKDSAAPNVSMDSVVETALSGWLKTTNVIVTGKADDTSGTLHSGIKSVEYSTDSTNGTDGSWTAFTLTDDATPNTKAWTGVIVFAESASNKLYIRATDNAGNVTNLLPWPRTIKVDATAPTLAETSVSAAPTPRSYNGNIVFQGTLKDTLSHLPTTMTLGYTKDGVAQTPKTVNVVTVDADTVSYSYTFAIDSSGHTDDGVYEFTLTGTDVAGNASSVNYTVTVETVPPAVAFNMSASDSTSGKYNGVVPAKASITDDNTIKSLYWQVSNSSTVPAYDPGSVKTNAAASSVGAGWTQVSSSLNSLNVSWDSSTVGTSGDETRYVWVVTSDRFGNIASSSNAMTVNQDTDIPIVTFTNYNPAATKPYVGETMLKGSVSDDDGVITAVSATVNGTSVPAGNIVLSGNNFEIPLGTVQEIKQVAITVTDKAGKAFSFDSSTKLKMTRGAGVIQPTSAISVILDTEDPDVVISSAQNQWMGTNFTISGTADDEFGIDGSTVTISGAGFSLAPQSVDGSHNWNATIPTTSITEGSSNSLTVSAMDGNGRTRSVTFQYKFDKTPPSVSLTTDVSGWSKTKAVSLAGSVSDTGSSGVKSVEYSTNSTNGSDGTWTGLTVSGGSWAGTVTFAESATNKLYLRATDNAGNVTNIDTDPLTTAVIDPYIVKVDATAPTLAETSVSAAPTPRSYNGNIVFQGTLKDTLSHLPTTMTLGYTKDGVAQTPKTVNVVTVDADTVSYSYTFAIDSSGHTDDGVYEFTLTGTDVAGNASSVNYTVTVETVPPAVAFNMSASDSTSGKYNGVVPAKASITDDNTIKSLYWQVSNSSTVPAYDPGSVKTNAAASSVGAGWTQVSSSLNSLNVSWDSSTVGTSGDETRYVWVVTSDRFGNIASSSNAMTVNQDTDIPIVTFTNYNPAATKPYVGETMLKGSVSDDDGVITAVSATVNGTSVPAGNIVLSGNNFEIPLGTVQEIKQVAITVTDKAGKAFSFDSSTKLKMTRGAGVIQPTSAISVILDTEDPDVVISSAQNQWMGTNFTISGTADDEFGIDGSTVTISGAGFSLAPQSVDGSHNWNATIPTTSITEGSSNSLTVSAMDGNGRTRSVTFQYKFDKTPPSVSLTTINAGDSTTFYDWKKTSSLSVVGTAADGTGSGIGLVEYSLNGTDWAQLSGTSAWNGSIPVTDGTPTLQFRAKDNAGNYSGVASYPVRIDLTNPTLVVSTPSSLIRVNGGAALSTAFISTDTGGSQIASVKLKIGSAVFSSPDASASLSSGTAESGTWSASIPAATLAALTNGQQYSVYVQNSDNAGNTATTSFPIVIDTQKPTSTFTTPLEGSTVNKTINVSGTGGDDQALSTVVVSIEKSDHTWNLLPGGTFNGTAGFNWSIPSFDTTLYSSATYDTDGSTAGIQLTLRAIATDEAGNVSTTATRTFTVDQDSDRPIVKLSNVNVDGTTTLKMTNTVYGTVTDDDGVSLFEVSENGSSWTTVASDGSWSYSASSGDGTKTLYFRVTDAAGTIFTTGGSDTPKIQYASTTVSTPIAFKVDTLPPELSSANPVVIDRTSAYDFADATAITANMPLGGGSSGAYHQCKLRVLAKDANGIGSVSVSLPGATGTPFTATASGADATEPTFTRYDTGLIDVSSMADGVATITVTVTDNSGLTSSVNRTVLIDNTAPAVTHSSPRSLLDVVNGEVTVKGLASDAGSGLSSIKYQVGLCADRSTNSASWIDVSGSLFSWEIPFAGANKIDTYGGLSVALDTGTDTFTLANHGFSDGTAVYFDGSTLATGMSSSMTYYVIGATTNTFQVSTSVGGVAVNFSGTPDALCVSKYSKDTNNDGIWELPVLIRAADAAGNVLIEDYSTYVVLVDPSGDKPKSTIVYPDPSNSNRTMGGTIRIFGTATDDDAVGSVYMQIDVDGDGSYTAADVDSTSKDWYAGGLGQLVSGTASWNQTINASGEFNPTTTDTRTIHFRVRAKDIYGTYGAWSADQTIIVDNKLPRIGSTNALTLTQGATSRLYVTDMWIKGAWTLTGSVEDESDIDKIQISGSITGSLSDNPSWFTHTNFGSNSGYTMAIPISTSGTGTLTITIAATDKSDPPTTNTQTLTINYDNTPPTDNGYTGSTPVVQSNKVYTLKGSVNESGSGFDKLAFYFERTPTTARVYNPMESRTGDANRTNMGGLTMVDGLPCLAVTGTRADAYTLTSSSIVGNKNVRAGGLVNIGGLYRYILTVNNTTGAITWADAVDVSVTSAYLAYAMVVNNTTIETPVWSGSTLTSITNDDGDGMVEAVERSGGLYSWTASIDSANIPDGPIDIHYVAYDKAGNYTPGTVSTSVANNLPLLAKVTLGTDLNGDGSVSALEQVTAFSALDGGGNRRQTATVSSSSFIAKDLTSVDIDVIGGNGILGYTLTYNSALQTGYNDPVTANILRATESGSVNTIYLTAAALTSIGDTVTKLIPANTANAKSLIFKIWDSTEETTRGTNSQCATLTVPMQIDITDDVKPTATITPFYWNSASDNSLYGNSRTNGHIEITGVVGGTDPDVSGQISIRGTASDDTRLSSLWMSIADSNPTTRFAFTGATVTKTVNGKTYYQVATYNPATATWIGTDQWSANGWKFSVTPVSLTQSGHTVSWQLDWDTSKVANVAALDNLVRVLADDKQTTTSAAVAAGSFVNGNYYRIETIGTTDYTLVGALSNGVGVIFKATGVGSGTGTATLASPNSSDEDSVQTATGALTGFYSMDVVPYITSIKTSIDSLLSADYDRGSTGQYPVLIQSVASTNNPVSYETITLNGFNINPSTLSGTSSDIRLSKDQDGFDATYTTRQGSGLTGSGVSPNYTSMNVQINAAGSGYLTVITHDVPSLNNIDANSPSNSETTSIHQSLYDDRYLSIWDIRLLRDTAAAPLAKNAVYPSMVMSGNTPQFSYDNNAQGYGLAEYWTGSSEKEMYESWDLFTHTAATLNSSNSRLALYDVNVVSQGSDYIGDKGGIMVNLFYDPPDSVWSTSANYYRDYDVWLDNLYKSGNSAVLDRYQFPDISSVGDDALTHVFYSVYDSIDDRVIFRYIRTGTNQTRVAAGASSHLLNDTGTNLYINSSDIVQRNESGTWPSYANNSGTSNTRFGNNNNSGNTNAGQYIGTGTGMGMYSAVAGVSTGTDTARGILVYYSANTLYYQYATNDANTAWSSAVALDTNVGADYVRMVVDSANHVHIAYQDSFAGNVKYIYIGTYNSPSTRTSVTVDSYLTVGEKLGLSVPSGSSIPYITYKGLGNTAKMAWLKGSLGDGVDASEKFNGTWDVQVLPVKIIDSDTNRFSIGIGSNGLPVVGYSNSVPGKKGIEYITRLAELSN